MCNKKVKFGKVALKCSGCQTVYHSKCREFISPLCSKPENTPKIIRKLDSASSIAPVKIITLQNIVIGCVTEIEKRGLTEEGIYRFPGCDKEIKGISYYENHVTSF